MSEEAETEIEIGCLARPELLQVEEDGHRSRLNG